MADLQMESVSGTNASGNILEVYLFQTPSNELDPIERARSLLEPLLDLSR